MLATLPLRGADSGSSVSNERSLLAKSSKAGITLVDTRSRAVITTLRFRRYSWVKAWNGPNGRPVYEPFTAQDYEQESNQPRYAVHFDNYLESSCFDRQGARLYCATDKEVLSFDSMSGRRLAIQTAEVEPAFGFQQIAVHPTTGEVVACSCPLRSRFASLRLLDPDTLLTRNTIQIPRSLAMKYSFAGGGCCYSPNGKYLAVAVAAGKRYGSFDSSRLFVYAVENWKVVFSMPGDYQRLAWSPDSRTLAGATYGTIVILGHF